MNKTDFISCECNSEVIRLDRFEAEDEIYLTVYQYTSKKYSLIDRFKILFGLKTVVCDMVFSKESFDKIRNF